MFFIFKKKGTRSSCTIYLAPHISAYLEINSFIFGNFDPCPFAWLRISCLFVCLLEDSRWWDLVCALRFGETGNHCLFTFFLLFCGNNAKPLLVYYLHWKVDKTYMHIIIMYNYIILYCIILYYIIYILYIHIN